MAIGFFFSEAEAGEIHRYHSCCRPVVSTNIDFPVPLPPLEHSQRFRDHPSREARSQWGPHWWYCHYGTTRVRDQIAPVNEIDLRHSLKTHIYTDFPY